MSRAEPKLTWRFGAQQRWLARLNRPVIDFVARLPLRLESKLLVAFLGAVGLLVLLGAYGLATLSATGRRTEAVLETERRIDAYRQVEHDSRDLLILISTAVWLPGQTVDQATKQIERFRESLAGIRPVSSEEAADIETLQKEYERFAEAVNRNIALLRAGNVDQAGAMQTEQVQPAAAKLEALTDHMVDKAVAEMAANVVAMRDLTRAARNRLIAFVIVAGWFGIYLAHTMSSFVVRPLREVGGRLAQIAGGEFTQRVAIGNRDEIGALADNVNRTSEQLGQLYTALEAEKERSEDMLYNVLPRRIVERMLGGENPIADRIPEATILFSDMAGFTELSDHLAPEDVVEMLDVLFSRFDAIAERLGLEKIKTIGDGYMLAGGVLVPRVDHAAAVAEMALAMRGATDMATRALGVIGRPLRVRIGIHSGPLVAGVLGTNKLVYDVWGDTVNTASRMEKYGEPGRIAVSAATRALLTNQFRFEPRPPIEVKGKGLMETFFLERHIGPMRHRNVARRVVTPLGSSK